MIHGFHGEESRRCVDDPLTHDNKFSAWTTGKFPSLFWWQLSIDSSVSSEGLRVIAGEQRLQDTQTRFEEVASSFASWSLSSALRQFVLYFCSDVVRKR